MSLITSSGLPDAIIFPLDKIIALLTQLNKSLAWWSHTTTVISSADCKLSIISCIVMKMIFDYADSNDSTLVVCTHDDRVKSFFSNLMVIK